MFVKFSNWTLCKLRVKEEDLLLKYNIPAELNDDSKSAILYFKIIERNFLVQIQSLIDCIQILGIAESGKLCSLVSQLDYNDFYSGMEPLTEYVQNPIVPTR